MTDNEQLSPHEDPVVEVTDNLSETARALFSAGSVTDTVQRVVDVATETIDGCDFAGIFILEGAAITTPAHTNPIVIEIDTLQHETGEGPCLDAISSRGSVYADELAYDNRWPQFGPRATAAGIHSALAYALSANGTRGALNCYARLPRAFGVEDRAKGQILATLAGIALSTAQAHEAEERRAENLQAALITREMIGQATGILMERERITSDQAFEVLRRASQHLNIKLRDVAQGVVETGERPATNPPGPVP